LHHFLIGKKGGAAGLRRAYPATVNGAISRQVGAGYPALRGEAQAAQSCAAWGRDSNNLLDQIREGREAKKPARLRGLNADAQHPYRKERSWIKASE